MQYQFTDLVDITGLRKLLEDFYRLTGVGNAILDDRNNILIDIGWQDICTRFHRVHPVTLNRCQDSDRYLFSETEEKFKVYKCRNGLVDVATAIKVDGQHLATIFIGQFLTEEADIDYFRAQAEEFNFNVDEYLDALSRVPVIPLEKVAEIMQPLVGIAQMLSELGWQQIKLKESEKYRETYRRLADIIDFLPDATFVIDREQRVIAWNRTMEEMTGVKAKNIVGQKNYASAVPFYDRRRPLLIDFLFENDQAVEKYYPFVKRRGRTLTVEGFASTVEGKEAFLNIKATPLYDHTCNVVGAIECIRNIIERKHGEQALRYREEFEKLLVEISSGFINVGLDEIDRGINETLRSIGEFVEVECGHVFLFSEDGVKTQCTHGWVKEGGKLQSMVVSPWVIDRLKAGETVYIPHLSDLPPEAASDFARAASLGIKSFVMVPMVSKGVLVGFVGFDSLNSEKIWSEDAIVLFKIVGETILNVLERKWKEAELRESEAKYRLLIENSSDIICAARYDGTVLVMNHVAAGYLGGRPEEYIGLRLTDLFTDSYGVNRMEDVRKVIETGQGITVAEETVMFQGRQLWFCTNVQPVFEPDGEIRSAQIISRDITEHKQFAKEMARLDRLNLLGEIAASIGHEVRNPLTTVRGFLQLLEDKKELNDYKEFFEIMIDEVDRSNNIITEFLSLAKNRYINLKSRSLNTIVKGLFPLIEADALINDKQVKIDIGDIPELLLDDNEIRQLVLNLARNGLEAMDAGGTLTIRTFAFPGCVILSVHDQGRGFDPDVIEKISTPVFKDILNTGEEIRTYELLGTPFISTKETGTGLGLAICCSIAARHNAEIDIETCPFGTALYVRFKIGAD